MKTWLVSSPTQRYRLTVVAGHELQMWCANTFRCLASVQLKVVTSGHHLIEETLATRGLELLSAHEQEAPFRGCVVLTTLVGVNAQLHDAAVVWYADADAGHITVADAVPLPGQVAPVRAAAVSSLRLDLNMASLAGQLLLGQPLLLCSVIEAGARQRHLACPRPPVGFLHAAFMGCHALELPSCRPRVMMALVRALRSMLPRPVVVHILHLACSPLAPLTTTPPVLALLRTFPTHLRLQNQLLPALQGMALEYPTAEATLRAAAQALTLTVDAAADASGPTAMLQRSLQYKALVLFDQTWRSSCANIATMVPIAAQPLKRKVADWVLRIAQATEQGPDVTTSRIHSAALHVLELCAAHLDDEDLVDNNTSPSSESVANDEEDVWSMEQAMRWTAGLFEMVSRIIRAAADQGPPVDGLEEASHGCLVPACQVLERLLNPRSLFVIDYLVENDTWVRHLCALVQAHPHLVPDLLTLAHRHVAVAAYPSAALSVITALFTYEPFLQAGFPLSLLDQDIAVSVLAILTRPLYPAEVVVTGLEALDKIAEHSPAGALALATAGGARYVVQQIANGLLSTDGGLPYTLHILGNMVVHGARDAVGAAGGAEAVLTALERRSFLWTTTMDLVLAVLTAFPSVTADARFQQRLAVAMLRGTTWEPFTNDTHLWLHGFLAMMQQMAGLTATVLRSGGRAQMLTDLLLCCEEDEDDTDKVQLYLNVLGQLHPHPHVSAALNIETRVIARSPPLITSWDWHRLVAPPHPLEEGLTGLVERMSIPLQSGRTPTRTDLAYVMQIMAVIVNRGVHGDKAVLDIFLDKTAVLARLAVTLQWVATAADREASVLSDINPAIFQEALIAICGTALTLLQPRDPRTPQRVREAGLAEALTAASRHWEGTLQEAAQTVLAAACP